MLNDGKDLLPSRLGFLIIRDSEEPIALRMGQCDGDGVAADVEVDQLFGEVGSETATGSCVFLVIVETYGFRIFEQEVCISNAAKRGQQRKGSHSCKMVAEQSFPEDSGWRN